MSMVVFHEKTIIRFPVLGRTTFLELTCFKGSGADATS